MGKPCHRRLSGKCAHDEGFADMPDALAPVKGLCCPLNGPEALDMTVFHFCSWWLHSSSSWERSWAS